MCAALALSVAIGAMVPLAAQESTPAAGPASASRLSGSVLDATGLPLAGATVTLRGAMERVTNTDADGRFDFVNLSDGQYELAAALHGFATTTQPATVTPGQQLRVSLTLTIQILEQTVVTAAKTGEADVQGTPMAVSVLSGADLARMQDRTVEHIAGRAPGVSFSQNTGLAQLTIRGIGTNAVFAGSDPSSAVYLDGVYLARPGDGARGFSGCRSGRSAARSAGDALRPEQSRRRDQSDLQSADQRAEASVRVAGGNHGTFRTEARVSGPIVRGR